MTSVAGDSASQSQPVTLKYKSVDGVDILLDAYFPFVEHPSAERVPAPAPAPAVVFFHGGGLTVGSRRSWFPYWLQTRINAVGYIFISADYRLLSPSTAHDILADIKDLFQYLATQFNRDLALQSADDAGDWRLATRLDVDAIAVAGGSAGGLCAYLAAMHASPKPRAVVSIYGGGGNHLAPRYYTPIPSDTPIDTTDVSQYLYPACLKLPPTPYEDLIPHPDSPFFPANPRFKLVGIWVRQGVYLDYYTGCHEPSLCAAIRAAAAAAPASVDPSLSNSKGVSPLAKAIPPEQRAVFPTLGVTPDWPPVLFVHGDEDVTVSIEQSQHLHGLLRDAGVDATLKSVEGQGHGFDVLPEAEERYGQSGGLFDEVVGFLVGHLGTGR